MWLSAAKPGCPRLPDSGTAKRAFTKSRIGLTERKLAVIPHKPAGPIARAGGDIGVHIGTAEPVDRLLRIADQKKRAWAQPPSHRIIAAVARFLAAEPPQDLDLQRIGILKLVNQHMAKAVGQSAPDPLMAGE